MSTKNITPRSNNEGSIGTKGSVDLKWKEVNAISGSFDKINSNLLKNNLDSDLLIAGSNVTITYSNNQYQISSSGGGSSSGDLPSIQSASPSSNYTISTSTGIEEIYLLNPSADIDVILPDASQIQSGYKFNIKNLSNNTITVLPLASPQQYIDNSTSFDIQGQNSSITIVTDSNSWYII